MEGRAIGRVGGIVTAVATVLVLAVPYAIIAGHEELLLAYYTAGPIGAGGVGLLALLSAVVLASIDRGNVDPGTLAGVATVMTAATTLLAVVWYLHIDATVVFSFPAEYRWLEWHAPAVVVLSLGPLVGCAMYAKDFMW